MSRTILIALACGAMAVAGAVAAHATWSIIIVDTRTREVAIGSATCLTNFNLARGLPVVRVEVGAAAAQSAIDSNGANRLRIWNGFADGLSPAQILQILDDNDTLFETRQYGIVDVQGRALTFTGALCGAYANGLTGQFGTLVYAIQGNVITGQPVLDLAEAAVLQTPGGIPEKLMAAMEAARSMGGDGRCSCSPDNPPGCGSPPPHFTKSAHIGFMIDARRGDVEGVCNPVTGCASGQYYMYFNLPNQPPSAPDPVIQLRGLFDAWRAGLVGVPDATASTLSLSRVQMLNDGHSTATLRIELRDFQGTPVENPRGLGVLHDTGSDCVCGISPPVALGGGVFETTITAGSSGGLDRLTAIYLEGTAVRYVTPSVELRVQDQRGDLNGDGAVDLQDLAQLLSAFGVSAGGDTDGDGDTDLADLTNWLTYL